MKIAYLITAYSNFVHLKRLIDALDEPNVAFYIHVDKKSDFREENFRNEKVHFIDRIKVSWGGWSHQQAILDLMVAAHKTGYNRYVLLSEADYPITSNEALHAKLKQKVEYLNLLKGFHDHKPEERIKYMHFDGFDRRDKTALRTRIFTTLESWLKLVYRKKRCPFPQIYHGTTWWALSKDAVAYILSFVEKNRNYVAFFKTSWCPEESFIPTILGNSNFKERCVGNLTYSDWSTKPPPAIITNEHVALLKETRTFKSPYGAYTPYFARKFNDQSAAQIEQIEQTLRN